MMKAKNIFLVLAMTTLSSTFAQTKLDLGLNHIVARQQATARQAVARGQQPQKDQSFVTVIAQLTPGAQLPTAELQELGAKVCNQIGSFVVLAVPACQLQTLGEMDAFSSIEQDKMQQVNNMTSRTVMRVDSIHDETLAKAEQLPHAYTGKGVVVGVVDVGIDFNHNNFRDPVNHNNRIKKAVLYHDYVSSMYGITDSLGNPVALSEIRDMYTDPKDIDALTSDTQKASHGTHTSSTAAGSYAGSYVNLKGDATYSNLQGEAPEADLVLVGLGGNGQLPTTLALDGIDKICQKADSLKEPCVINLSYGSTADWNDGKIKSCQFYDELTQNGSKPGIILCQSAGNDGDTNWTFRYTLADSNNYTLRTFIDTQVLSADTTLKALFDLISAYSDDTTSFDISLELWEVREDSTLACVDSTSFTAQDLLDNGIVSNNHYTDHDNRFASYMEFNYETALTFPRQYYAAVVFRSKSNCTIRGHFKEYNLLYNHLFGIDVYKFTGTRFELLGSPDYSINGDVCTNSVLSVGAWTASNDYIDYYGTPRRGGSKWGIDDSADFSSYCVADENGVQRPDFSAPGVAVESGYNSYDVTSWCRENVTADICGVATEEYLEGHTSVCGSMDGTSMSCPNATGVIALWLQADPSLCINDIRAIVKETADHDDFTFASPARFGSGKLNALKGLKWILQNRPVAIRDINAVERLTSDDSVRKALVNGRMIIVKNGVKYDVNGTRMKE